MKTEIDYNALSEEGKSLLLEEAENGCRPSEAILRIIERETFRRGFRLHLTTPSKLSQPRKGKHSETKKQTTHLKEKNDKIGNILLFPSAKMVNLDLLER